MDEIDEIDEEVEIGECEEAVDNGDEEGGVEEVDSEELEAGGLLKLILLDDEWFIGC